MITPFDTDTHTHTGLRIYLPSHSYVQEVLTHALTQVIQSMIDTGDAEAEFLLSDVAYSVYREVVRYY